MRDKAYFAFHTQKSDAARRGIVWAFTLDEWKLWWEDKLGSNWLELRGNKRGQYCMARCGDAGPYHPSNVRCATTEENLSEAHLGRKKTDDHKAKIGLANKGKKRNQDFKEKMRELTLGSKRTEEAKLKTSFKTRGSLNPSAKRTEAEIRYIKMLISKGYTNAKIVKLGLCSHGLASSLRHGRTWKHVHV